MAKLHWTERVAYALGVVACIIGDAIHDAWIWLQCPAPDQVQPVEDSSSLSNRVVAGVAIVVIIGTLISLTGTWWFSPK